MRRSSPSSPADRGARPFENGFEPWTARGGLQAALEKNVLSKARLQPPGGLPVPPLAAWIVASGQAGRASDRPPPPGSASFAIQPTSAAPASPKNQRACATFLGLCLTRCSASDPEPLLLPLARRPPCGTTNHSKEESFLEGFVGPGWGRLGAAGPVEIVSDCHVVRSSGAAGAWAGFGPAGAGIGERSEMMETTPPRPRRGAGAGEEEAGALLLRVRKVMHAVQDGNRLIQPSELISMQAGRALLTRSSIAKKGQDAVSSGANGGVLSPVGWGREAEPARRPRLVREVRTPRV